MPERGRPIVVWDRRLGREVEERVYGGTPLEWLYGTAAGRLATTVLSRPWFSRLVGRYYGSAWSRNRIEPFIRAFAIPMDEYHREPWRSFNEFFVRRFRDGARPFRSEPDALPAFAEGRYLAWDRVEPSQRFPVKGSDIDAAALAGGVADAGPFRDGPAVLARLCPVDYHRYHYPDDGRTLLARRVPGRLHSVNPAALRARSDVLCSNERRVAVLDTRNFGRLLFVEVGAMNVGRIVQTHPEDRPYRRGDEKGYFEFGASSIVLFGEAGRWRPDRDLIDRTAERIETLVRLGERIGAAVRSDRPVTPTTDS